MQNDKLNPAQFVSIVIGAVILAMLFLTFWVQSADEPWSSEPWLINTVIVLVLGGPPTLLFIAYLFWLRRK